MQLEFPGLSVALLSQSDQINRCWQQLLSPWLVDSGAQASQGGDDRVVLQLRAANRLPEPPQKSPDAVHRYGHPGYESVIAVYRLDLDHTWFHFQDRCALELQMGRGSVLSARGTFKAAAVNLFSVEEITFRALAPLLRRAGYYSIHAFGAGEREEATLIAGPSGSGKTTAGLCLLHAGWRFLGNDTVLLWPQEDLIWAAPTPGKVNIRRGSLEAFPELYSYLASARARGGDRRQGDTIYLTADELAADSWSKPLPVGVILHPTVDAAAETRVNVLAPAVSMAQLLEESVDRWDEALLPAHMDFLGQLCLQARSFELSLGTGMEHLSQIIESLLANSGP